MDKSKKYFFLLAFIYSLATSYNVTSFYFFLIYFLVNFVFSLLLIHSSFRFVLGFKTQRTVQSILQLSSIALLIIFLFFSFRLVHRGACLTAYTPPHYRTNIFTNKCEYGGSDGCLVQDPWYYREGCASPELEKEALEESPYDEEYDNSIPGILDV